MNASPPVLEEIREALRSPYVPQSLTRLAEAEGYLEAVWPRVASSVETAGFLGSALYMADMALDAVEGVYEPVLTRASLLAAGSSAADLEALAEVVDVFHYVQPQVLLLLAALAEAMAKDEVGGHGKVDPRPVTDRERRHLATHVPSVDEGAGVLPAVEETLGVAHAPDLYRAMAAWPAYLETAWEELQHLVAYPEFRRRGRGLYFYARSGARFLAEPLRANPEALRAAGLRDEAIDQARAALDETLTPLATMMMHTEAIRLTLGIRDREVVKN
jgi:hypothetical protein